MKNLDAPWWDEEIRDRFKIFKSFYLLLSIISPVIREVLNATITEPVFG